MAEFLSAYRIVRKNEGGYVNDPNDKGGETYCGISRNNYPDWKGWKIVDNEKPLKKGALIDNAELEGLVAQFYKQTQWDVMRGDFITSQEVATYIYDWFVNSKNKAIMRIQEVLGIEQTGNLRDKTLSAINSMDEAELLKKIHERRLKFYSDHVELVKSDEKFLDGWNNRANNLYENLS